MSLFSKAARFARSERGKQAVEKAKEFADKPETKEKIERVREKVSGKDKAPEPGAPAGGTPAASGAPGQSTERQPAQGNPPATP